MIISTLAPNETWYTQGNSNIPRSIITEINIIKSYNCAGVLLDAKWDASELKNNSIIVSITGTKLIISYNGIDKILANSDSSYMFSSANPNNRFSNLKSITGLNLIDFSNANLMNNMFYYCSSLSEIDMSSVSTINATKIKDIFIGMDRLEKISIGENFKYNGNGKLQDNIPAELPIPNNKYIEGANEKWYNLSGESFYSKDALKHAPGIYFSSYIIIRNELMFIKNGTLIDIGDAIRFKTSSNLYIKPKDMNQAIRSIHTGGIDTSDATALPNQIFKGSTAYVASGKITGTFSINSEIEDQNRKIESIEQSLKNKCYPIKSIVKVNISTNENSTSKLIGSYAYIDDKGLLNTIDVVDGLVEFYCQKNSFIIVIGGYHNSDNFMHDSNSTPILKNPSINKDIIAWHILDNTKISYIENFK